MSCRWLATLSADALGSGPPGRRPRGRRRLRPRLAGDVQELLGQAEPYVLLDHVELPDVRTASALEVLDHLPDQELPGGRPRPAGRRPPPGPGAPGWRPRRCPRSARPRPATRAGCPGRR